jgi:hypothetical protein
MTGNEQEIADLKEGLDMVRRQLQAIADGMTHHRGTAGSNMVDVTDQLKATFLVIESNHVKRLAALGVPDPSEIS